MPFRDLIRKLGPEDPPIAQAFTCAPEGYFSAGEGGNIDHGLLVDQVSVKVLCSEASNGNFVSESVYSSAKSKDPGAFKGLGEMIYRPGVDKVKIMSLYGGSEVPITRKVEIPFTYRGKKLITKVLVAEKLFGGMLDMVLGAPFFNDHSGARIIMFYDESST